MRFTNAVLTLVLTLSVGAVAWAADEGQERTLVILVQDLDLTDEQEAKIAEIRRECRSKVEEAGKSLRALAKEQVDKISAVLTEEQRQKIQEIKEERAERREKCLAHTIASLKELDLTDAEMTKIGEIRQEFRPKMERVTKQLDGLLSDTQKAARAEAVKADKTRRELLASLALTDDQQGKLRTVAKEANALVKEEMEKIRDVLTASQRETLQDLREERKEYARDRLAHWIANLKDLNLTDDQKAKIQSIRQEYRSKIHEAGNRLRASVRDEVEKIAAVINK
jgi:Spy/CpxP family protein refolding chaperone